MKFTDEAFIKASLRMRKMHNTSRWVKDLAHTKEARKIAIIQMHSRNLEVPRAILLECG